MYPVEPLIVALKHLGNLGETDAALLRKLPARTKSFRAGGVLVEQGSQPTESCLVIGGLAARTHIFSDGARQIAALHIAGDFVDLHSIHLQVMDHEVMALGHCDAAFFSHRDLIKLAHERASIMNLFWRLTVRDAAISRAWVSSMGVLSAEQRLAFLICEVYARLEMVGLADDEAFSFPVTQSEVSDMLGLTNVHVNRTLQTLRKKGLIEWQNQRVRILARETLEALAEFDDNYLRLSTRYEAREAAFEGPE